MLSFPFGRHDSIKGFDDWYIYFKSLIGFKPFEPLPFFLGVSLFPILRISIVDSFDILVFTLLCFHQLIKIIYDDANNDEKSH